MPKDNHKKIALIAISLAGGGAERSTALLSQMLDANGFEVHIITLTNAIDYDYAGTLFNLGLYKTGKDTLVKRLVRFTKLKTYLDREKFDVIIDNRNRSNAYKEAYYLNYLYRNEAIIYVARSFKLENYFPLGAKVATKMIQKSAGIVGVSQEIAKTINFTFNTTKAFTIYNPIEDISIENNIKEEYYIFVGRLVDKVKNVSLLIDAFAKAYLKNTTYSLKICGDGPDKVILQQKVVDLGLERQIFFEAYDAAIYEKMAAARALILTSHYEGFPRVIIEALSLGTPVISVDCKSGPKEVVKNNYNGILVPNHDAVALAEAIHTLSADHGLYTHCVANAQASVNHLTMEKIGQQWIEYLNTL